MLEFINKNVVKLDDQKNRDTSVQIRLMGTGSQQAQKKTTIKPSPWLF
jgi:hypothetical protein